MDIDSKSQNINDKSLKSLYNILIPEDDFAWPEASTIGTELIENLAPEDQKILVEFCTKLDGLDPARQVEKTRQFEQGHPALFGRVLKAVYAAYYTNPNVLERVRQLAEAAPREPSPHFDPSLLAQVRANEPGKRRL